MKFLENNQTVYSRYSWHITGCNDVFRTLSDAKYWISLLTKEHFNELVKFNGGAIEIHRYNQLIRDYDRVVYVYSRTRFGASKPY